MSVQLLYEEGPVLVVLKPAGVLTQAPPGIDSVEVRVREFLKAREQRSGKFYLVVCHRLDRPVSGALMFARNVRAAQRLGKQLERREVQKIYWAPGDRQSFTRRRHVAGPAVESPRPTQSGSGG